MRDLIIAYGPVALTWVLAALGSLLTRYVWVHMGAGFVRDVLQRAWVEVNGAVLEVSQTYSDAIKAASADGTLTDAEALSAKERAIAIARTNLGAKGLKRLERVLGIDTDKWLGSKVEQAVKLLATPSGEAPLPTFPDDSETQTVSKPSPRRPA